MTRALFLALVIAFTLIPQVHSEEPDIPRNAQGRPDFTGAWLSPWITTLERMPGATTLEVDSAEAKRLGESYFDALASRGAGVDPEIFAGNVQSLVPIGGQYRTSIVSDPRDGRVPYTAQGRAIVDAARGRILHSADGPEARPDTERCIAGHGRPPMTMTPSMNPRQIVQAGDNIAIYTEDGPDLRVVRFGGQPMARAVKPAGGDSRARWDGDELVIDTVSLQPAIRGGVQGSFATSADTQVSERLKFISADEILYRYEITDPTLYTRSWKGEYVMVRDTVGASEYACHEGNYSMFNMLQSARAADRRLGRSTP